MSSATVSPRPAGTAAVPGAPAGVATVLPVPYGTAALLRMPEGPSEIPSVGMYGHYAASEIEGVADGSLLASWPDVGPHGRDMPDSPSPPTYVANVRNGHSAVRFTGTQWTMRSGAPNVGTEGATIWCVAFVDENVRPNNLFSWNASAGGTNRIETLVPWVDGDLFWSHGNEGAGGKLQAPAPAGLEGAWHIFECHKPGIGGEVSEVRIDGVVVLSGPMTDALDPGTGELRLGGTLNAGLAGFIAEVVFYDEPQTDLDRRVTRALLATKYAIPVAEG